ncbi:hypothetical protein E2562_031983 [Oryza meyeriana var. granulata]|uniref:Uncharacterized protein n=1 Tax=Oryza meyeriana var. granulata TaxID=110450 RepID=A0A6G1F0F3_9ORYZ|nr:hypothetical protein E2562_031983 [Oryza meyeriana var. granulata]
MEAIVAEPIGGQQQKSSTELVTEVLPKSNTFLRNMGLQSTTKTSERSAVNAQVQDLQAQLETEKQESAGLREEVGDLKEQIVNWKKAQHNTEQLIRQMINFNQSQVAP